MKKESIKKRLVVGTWSNQPPTKEINIDYIDKILKYYQILKNQYYVDLLFILLEKRYIYYRELRALKNINWQTYISSLIEYGILSPVSLDSDLKSFIKQNNGLGDYHISKLKFYDLSREAYEFYGKSEMAAFIFANASQSAVNKVEEDKNNFIRMKEEVKEKQVNEIEFKKLRYKQIMMKNPAMRTAEDWAILSSYMSEERKQK